MIDFQTLNRYRECLAICELETMLCESHLAATRQAYLHCEHLVNEQRARLHKIRGLVEEVEAALTPSQAPALRRFG